MNISIYVNNCVLRGHTLNLLWLCVCLRLKNVQHLQVVSVCSHWLRRHCLGMDWGRCLHSPASRGCGYSLPLLSRPTAGPGITNLDSTVVLTGTETVPHCFWGTSRQLSISEYCIVVVSIREYCRPGSSYRGRFIYSLYCS